MAPLAETLQTRTQSIIGTYDALNGETHSVLHRNKAASELAFVEASAPLSAPGATTGGAGGATGTGGATMAGAGSGAALGTSPIGPSASSAGAAYRAGKGAPGTNGTLSDSEVQSIYLVRERERDLRYLITVCSYSSSASASSSSSSSSLTARLLQLLSCCTPSVSLFPDSLLFYSTCFSPLM